MSSIRRASLDELITMAISAGAEYERRFGGLGAAQLNWRPNRDEWSIGLCVEHVIMANISYYPQIKQILAGTRATRLWERVPLLPGLFGQMLISVLEPGANNKVRAPKVFTPDATNVPADVMARFSAQHQELLRLMERCRSLDAAHIIITSPAERLITYSLLDAFRIIVVHLQHHFHQTSKLLAMAEFPR